MEVEPETAGKRLKHLIGRGRKGKDTEKNKGKEQSVASGKKSNLSLERVQ